ncbi:MAG: hydrogenase maturation nickel metallochaperone HypA [Deltaproteobacteria bacterium]|nr:hydrogenase maturation nickel metallochaperone HypA [Deltaproteobacteria bacterium]
MHELSIAQSIVECLRTEIGEKTFSKIEVIRMEIGRLAGVSVESLEFSLKVLLGKRSEIRILDAKIVEPEVRCYSCKKVYLPEDMIWICPFCGDVRAELIKGNEIKVIDVEVNDES